MTKNVLEDACIRLQEKGLHIQNRVCFCLALNLPCREGALDPSDRLYYPSDTKTLLCGSRKDERREGGGRGGSQGRKEGREEERKIMSAIDVKRAKKDGRSRYR